MKNDRPSLTAQRVAVRRAEHQIIDRPLIFEDPIAIRIIGTEAAAEITAGTRNREGVGGRALRAFIVARSRFAEDELAKAVRSGVRQYVVLGAGLDTFSYRNLHSELGLRVFEVDHPATQGWKRRRLENAGIAIPSSTVFVAVDFERQTLDAELSLSGFKANEAAFFSWLGVTPYLTPDKVIGTLRMIHAMSGENQVVFDYAMPRSSLNWLNRIAFDRMATRVAFAGEPFQGFFVPSELMRALHEMGYRKVEDLPPGEINTRYFAGRSDGLRIRGELGRFMSAGPDRSGNT
jgi:methyltransferase (TIGR00027 family)